LEQFVSGLWCSGKNNLDLQATEIADKSLLFSCIYSPEHEFNFFIRMNYGSGRKSTKKLKSVPQDVVATPYSPHYT
jgi:hypothetical protein